MTDDDTPTGWKFYRTGYSYARRGWCVFIQENNNLFYFDGPWDSEREALNEMQRLNREQGTNI